MFEWFRVRFALAEQVGIIGFFKMIVQIPAVKCIVISLPEGSQVQRIGIAEKKDAVFCLKIFQGSQLFDPLGGKIK